MLLLILVSSVNRLREHVIPCPDHDTHEINLSLSNLMLKLILSIHTAGMSTDKSITTAAGSLSFTMHKNIYLNLNILKPELDFAVTLYF